MDRVPDSPETEECRFLVTVRKTDGGSWQGVLELPDGRTQPFRSELELLCAVRALAAGLMLPH